MRRSIMTLFLVMTALVSSASFADSPLKLKADSPSVEFKAIGKPSMLKVTGKSTKLEMKVDLKQEGTGPGVLKGSFEFPLDSLDTGIGLRNSHMKEKYLETAKFPTAKLEIIEANVPAEFFAKESGEQILTVKGNLTLHGVTKPIEAQTRLVREGTGFTAESDFKLKLTDHGVEIPRYLGIVFAEDVDVKIRFTTE